MTRLFSGYLQVPLLGEFSIERGSGPQGRYWLDAAMENLNVEVFMGRTHIIWSIEPKGLAALTFVFGWLLDPPMHALRSLACSFGP